MLMVVEEDQYRWKTKSHIYNLLEQSVDHGGDGRASVIVGLNGSSN